MKNAMLITIEGTDCSGKETQSNLLYDNLVKKGFKVKKYSFPFYESTTGKIISKCYLGREGSSWFEEGAVNVDPLTACTLFAIDRRNAFLKEIEKEMFLNDYIILDRYVSSNYGHQGGKGKTKKEQNKIISFINKLEFDLLELPKPDLTIFLHMPYKCITLLKKNREVLDEHEKSEEHLKSAEKSYLNYCKKFKWTYIKCANDENIKSIEDISKEVLHSVLSNKTNTEKKHMTRYI